MANIPAIITYRDAVESLQDFLGVSPATASVRQLLRAVSSAYREIAGAHTWRYLMRPWRIQLEAPQTDGTVAYDHTGGTYERQLTLTDSTWPSDAIYWKVRVDDKVCEIEDRKSSTVVTLHSQLNPGADVSSGASYTAFKSIYPLPNDFVSMGGAWGETTWRLGDYVDPETWMAFERYTDTTGDIQRYTVMALPDTIGTMGLFIYPASDAAETLDFIYRRHPRELRFSGFNDDVDTAGTITATSGSNVIAGSSTAFSSSMIGSILRVGTDATNVPTGRDGLYPFDDERSIVAVASTTSLTVDANIGTTRSGVKYVISDPIDLEQSMFNAFFRCCEWHMATMKIMKNAPFAERAYQDALHYAKCADSRSFQRRRPGAGAPIRTRLGDMTLSDDVE